MNFNIVKNCKFANGDQHRLPGYNHHRARSPVRSFVRLFVRLCSFGCLELGYVFKLVRSIIIAISFLLLIVQPEQHDLRGFLRTFHRQRITDVPSIAIQNFVVFLVRCLVAGFGFFLLKCVWTAYDM